MCVRLKQSVNCDGYKVLTKIKQATAFSSYIFKFKKLHTEFKKCRIYLRVFFLEIFFKKLQFKKLKILFVCLEHLQQILRIF